MNRHQGARGQLLGELNDLNIRLSFLRLFHRDGTLSAEELTNACDALADATDFYDERLGARFGGRTAFAERRSG